MLKRLRNLLFIVILLIPNIVVANVEENNVEINPSFHTFVNYNEEFTLPIEISGIQADEELIDLIILLDGSGSLSKTDFNHEKKAILDLIDSLDNGSNMQIGVIQYSAVGNLAINLTTDFQLLKDRVSNIRQLMYGSNLKPAFELAKSNFEDYGRTEAKKVIIVLNDGLTRDSENHEQIVSELKSDEVVIFSVFLGNNTLNDNLREFGKTVREIVMDLATNENYFFHASSIANDLPPIMSNLTQYILDYKNINFIAEVSNDFVIKNVSAPTGIITRSDSTVHWQSGSFYPGNETINLTLQHIGSNTGNLSVFTNANLNWKAGGTNYTKSITDFRITVLPQLQIDTNTLPDGMVNQPYHMNLSASGGSGDYSWKLISSSLPTGIELESTTGIISGTTLDIGVFPINIEVSDTNGNVQTKNLSLEIKESSNADLENLVLSEGTLTPSFSPEITEYTIAVGNGVTEIEITPSKADSTASIELNGKPIASGSSKTVPLVVGENTIMIDVIAQDGTKKPYKVVVIRAASSNADLANLELSEGSLTPSFAAEITEYEVSVGNEVTKIELTPTLVDMTASMVINEKKVTSDTVKIQPLTVGENIVTLDVTAQDGTKKTYKVVVIRVGSNNAGLSNLKLNHGNLTPRFDPNKTEYEVIVENEISEIELTPTVVDTTASLVINGESVTSDTIKIQPLTVGENIVTIEVTAQDGTKNTYKIVIIRRNKSYSGGGSGGSNVGESNNEESNNDIDPDHTKPKNDDENNSDHFVDLIDIKGHWAEGTIRELVQKNVITGYEDGTFRPNNHITRAEFVAIVIRALDIEIKEGKVFLDTENHWAKDIIATAYSNGIINGYNDAIFGANDPISREQMAMIIIATLKLSSDEQYHLNYKDTDQISTWALDAVQIASSLGMLTGYEDGSFRPKDDLTRAEAATVLKRVLDLQY